MRTKQSEVFSITLDAGYLGFSVDYNADIVNLQFFNFDGTVMAEDDFFSLYETSDTLIATYDESAARPYPNGNN